jgi:hypothetical protein
MAGWFPRPYASSTFGFDAATVGSTLAKRRVSPMAMTRGAIAEAAAP